MATISSGGFGQFLSAIPGLLQPLAYWNPVLPEKSATSLPFCFPDWESTSAVPQKSNASNALTIKFPLPTVGFAMAPGTCRRRNQRNSMSARSRATGRKNSLSRMAVPAAMSAAPPK